MKDSINHALVITTLLERDIARICASGNETQQGLAADCAEHRLQIANKLRHIASMEDIATVIESEQAFKAGDFNGDAPKLGAGWDEINRYCDAKAGDFNGYAHDGFGDIEQCSRELKSPERQEITAGEYRLKIDGDEYQAGITIGDIIQDDDINPVSDKAYHADLVRKENVEMWRNCDRRKNWLGCGLACIAAGAILAGIKIWFTYFSDL